MSALVVHEIQPGEIALRELVMRHPSLEAVNAELRARTGIEAFLNPQTWQKVREFRALSDASSAARTIREWGDFQTPPSLAATVCAWLQSHNIAPRVVIEPTFGLGNFLTAALNAFPGAELFYGVEIQACYEWHFKMSLWERALSGSIPVRPIQLFHDSIFTHQWSPKVLRGDELLILGNPPWVTSAELGVLESENLPAKYNRDALLGLDALTGKSNFDLNEAVLLRLMETFGARRGTLALLCKNSVVKNWVERLPRLSYSVHDVQALEIDAQKEFGAAVSASLLFARFGEHKRTFSCRSARLAEPEKVVRRFGWHGQKFVTDLDIYNRSADLDGVCPLVWRQGIKHDCAAVMELTPCGEAFVNGLGESVDVEREHVFPLLKSSDLRGAVAGEPRKWVVIPQRILGQPTSGLQQQAPRLWAYLNRHRAVLDARKSSIYRGKPAFSIFGVGPYSFAPFKVAVSGLYKVPRFTLIEPIEDQSVVLDDTCYFLGFDEPQPAQLAAFLLSSTPTLELLSALTFSDAKRPFTKELLMRLDLNAIRRRLSAQSFVDFWCAHGRVVAEEDWNLPLAPLVQSGQLSLI